ncbi:MAG: Mut7-C RNAse domain-containing protein [Methanomicrobiaceae archaeon]|nr:Mut7-C RNAse domain-containing protein [Methanomicrobiaceae archaeon]
MKNSFLADRMLGTLARYLRFMDYDTLSADSLEPGNTREDTVLLGIAHSDGRILLTRDRELSGRGEVCIYIESEDPLEQVRQLVDKGLISPDLSLKMHRCSICNNVLRKAKKHEIEECGYAPEDKAGKKFAWCPVCRKLYWMGSHAENLSGILNEVSSENKKAE